MWQAIPADVCTDAWIATGILLFSSDLTKVDQLSLLDQSQARPPPSEVESIAVVVGPLTADPAWPWARRLGVRFLSTRTVGAAVAARGNGI